MVIHDHGQISLSQEQMLPLILPQNHELPVESRIAVRIVRSTNSSESFRRTRLVRCNHFIDERNCFHWVSFRDFQCCSLRNRRSKSCSWSPSFPPRMSIISESESSGEIEY